MTEMKSVGDLSLVVAKTGLERITLSDHYRSPIEGMDNGRLTLDYTPA
jgi:hypothetical protein